MVDLPTTIDDLKPALWNPRTQTDESRAGLDRSVKTFGDISGIVWNSRTGHLVAGHQRLDVLRKWDAKLEGENGQLALVTPDGGRFPVRIVDWDEPTEKAANVTANNLHIAGDWTGELAGVLDELDREVGELVEGLKLGELRIEVPMIPEDNKDIDESALFETANECPKCGFKW